MARRLLLTGCLLTKYTDSMAMRERRGMVIKNTDTRPVTIGMSTRTIVLEPGGEKAVTADEVKDGTLRDLLQIRAVSIVRPTTAEEEGELIVEIQNSSR